MTATAIPTVDQAAATANSKAAASRTQFADNLDTFLTMLTTQLKNQDPLSPMDSTAFTNQLVQFANVEQQINANTNLEKLIGLQTANTMASAVSYIGTEIVADTDVLAVQKHLGNFEYTLDRQAAEVKVTIYDEDGKIVKTMSGDNEPGAHAMTWDGKDNNGNLLADGTFKVVVTAKDIAGEKIEPTITTRGIVSGVTAADGIVKLMLGKTEIPLGQVSGIKEPDELQPAA